MTTLRGCPPTLYRVHTQKFTPREMAERARALLDCGSLKPLPGWARIRRRAKQEEPQP